MVMSDIEEALALYEYSFPPELIANTPASPRESARLMIYDRAHNQVCYDTFDNITSYVPQGAVMVFNRTKVIPAKCTLKKKTGGTIGALFLEEKSDTISILASGSFQQGDLLEWVEGHTFTVLQRDQKEAILQPSFPMKDLMALLEKFGEMPLPPYIKNSPLTEEQKRREYQTIFAKKKGSVAAPTAGLHFSKELIKKIEQYGCQVAFITLHVGLGTFAPITEAQWQKKELHTEYYEIDHVTANLLNDAKADNRPILAVGTTTVRALESSFQDGAIVSGQGSTNLFITEDRMPRFVDGLITNFHVPRSSLLMLVSAFTGREKLFELYRQAIAEKMRLFSFGDGMLIV